MNIEERLKDGETVYFKNIRHNKADHFCLYKIHASRNKRNPIITTYEVIPDFIKVTFNRDDSRYYSLSPITENEITEAEFNSVLEELKERIG